MNDLEMIKAFAKLEGIDLSGLAKVNYDYYEWHARDGSKYNPITDLALNCAARDKYNVEIDYKRSEVSASDSNSTSGIIVTVLFTGCPNLAVIECILELAGYSG